MVTDSLIAKRKWSFSGSIYVSVQACSSSLPAALERPASCEKRVGSSRKKLSRSMLTFRKRLRQRRQSLSLDSPASRTLQFGQRRQRPLEIWWAGLSPSKSVSYLSRYEAL